MATVERFEDLEAWKLAREVTNDIFRLAQTNEFFARDYGLRDQINRSSISVMSNIAEGFERNGTKEFINFLAIAKGSSGEVRSQLYIARDREYVSAEQFEAVYRKTLQISRMISGLMKYLAQSDLKGTKYR